ncbi:MAG: SDR family oxidoreductase [Planctomycetota bacterium]|jgi:pteridine reductase
MTDRPHALVTGGARRVGAEICRALASGGCDVTLTYNTRADEAAALVDELRSMGAEAHARRLSLEDEGAIASLTSWFQEQFARLDVLVHNASTYSACALEDVTPQVAVRDYRVNALGPLLLTRDLAPLLRASGCPGGGAIVVMGDIHAIGRPRAGFAPYAMSKASLVEMMRSLARELAPDVRVNAVAPGVVAFPEEGFESDEAAQRAYLSRVPLGRTGTMGEAAEAVRWLALDATYTTGQVLRVDGGRWLV